MGSPLDSTLSECYMAQLEKRKSYKFCQNSDIYSIYKYIHINVDEIKYTKKLAGN